jgi:hypothetical protein
VKGHGATATRLWRSGERDAEPVEYARGSRVRCGRERRLHAAFQHQHAAAVDGTRTHARRTHRSRNLLPQPLGQHGTHHLRDPKERIEEGGPAHDPAQHAARERGRRTAAHTGFDYMASDVEQAAVVHARRARGLARPAGETAIEVELRLLRDRLAFQHLLHEIDAPARPVELVAEYLVSRAGRGAEAAVHALAQDRIRFAAFGRVLDEIGEAGLHQKSGYIRPGFSMPCGSKVLFSRRCTVRRVASSG